MYISKITKEDLSTLQLLVSKLEDSYNQYGVEFFNHNFCKQSPSSIYIDCYGDEYTSVFNEEEEGDYHQVNRTTIYFNSKANFNNYNDVNSRGSDNALDNTSSSIAIEWDKLTNVFNVKISHQIHYNDARNSGLLTKSNHDNISFYMDFKFENRRDIILIKTRLGLLYKKIKRDKFLERDMSTRARITHVAAKAFPDIFDSLILGE